MKRAIFRFSMVMLMFVIIVGIGGPFGGGCISFSQEQLNYDKVQHKPIVEKIFVGEDPEIVASYPWNYATPLTKDYSANAKRSKKTWIVDQSSSDGVVLDFYYELKDSVTVVKCEGKFQKPENDYIFSRFYIEDEKLAIAWNPPIYGIFPYFGIAFGCLIILGTIVGFIFLLRSMLQEFREEDEKIRKLPREITEDDVSQLMEKATRIK